MNDKKNSYNGRAKRMVERWAGKRMETNRNHPSTKPITNEAPRIRLLIKTPATLWNRKEIFPSSMHVMCS